MTDYGEISIIAGQLRGLLSRADRMTKNGIDLKRKRIGSVLEDGVHKDFVRIIKKARENNDGNGLGKHGMFVSLIDSEISSWSDLMDKCIILMPIVEGFERRLRPAEGSANT